MSAKPIRHEQVQTKAALAWAALVLSPVSLHKPLLPKHYLTDTKTETLKGQRSILTVQSSELLLSYLDMFKTGQMADSSQRQLK